MAISRTLPLDERIAKLRADIDTFVDARVVEIMKECPGIPAAALRALVTRGNGCQCAVYLMLNAEKAA